MSNQNAISSESTVVASQNLISSELAGEVVIMDIKSGVYLGLNPTDALIWNLIQKPRSVSEIRDAILKEYDVEPERCQEDVLAVLREMDAKGLLETVTSTNVALCS